MFKEFFPTQQNSRAPSRTLEQNKLFIYLAICSLTVQPHRTGSSCKGRHKICLIFLKKSALIRQLGFEYERVCDRTYIVTHVECG